MLTNLELEVQGIIPNEVLLRKEYESKAVLYVVRESHLYACRIQRGGAIYRPVWAGSFGDYPTPQDVVTRAEECWPQLLHSEIGALD